MNLTLTKYEIIFANYIADYQLSKIQHCRIRTNETTCELCI